MRFLLLNTDYPAFLHQLYSRDRSLATDSYAHQMAARNASFFGLGDGYARALRALGHEAHDVHMNNVVMQDAWARESARSPACRARTWRFRLRRGVMPWVESVVNQRWLHEVLAAQIAHYRPDVILNHDIAWIPPSDLRRMSGPSVLLVGQHAAPPVPDVDYRPYDLIVSSWPPTRARLSAKGVRTAHLGLGFDPAVLPHIEGTPVEFDLSFVGSLSALHAGRVRLLEAMCASVPNAVVFAPSVQGLPRSSSVVRAYAGPAFGLDMFRVLAASKVTLNHHGFPEPHANNMRLFEATGVGTLLLTDLKPDLSIYFEPGEEVMVYRDVADCVATVGSLTSATRDRIAASGQRRTVTEHTWAHRVDELLGLIESATGQAEAVP